MLEGGVGYLAFYGFGWPESDCSHRVAGALQAVAGAQALIVDLRENADDTRSGMAYVASYLVAGCTHVSDAWDRRTGRPEALYTHDGLPGRAFGGTKPLVVLTSARTFAAAEEMAYALQSLGHATVVGERTGGGAETTAVGPVGEHLLVRVPVARVTNPVTGTTWQGVGVEPDVPVPAGEALATARRLLAQRLTRAGRVLWETRAAAAAANRPGTGRVAVAPRARPAPAGSSAVPPGPLRGIRFAVDTLGAPGQWRSPLTRVAGVVEFAAGRGRFDVVAVRQAPAATVNGVAVAEPLARPGDYYLFDNTGAVLVRPATRTFARVAFTRADYNHTGALLPGAFPFSRRGIWGSDTQAVDNADAQRQHGPVAVHWHMQPRTDPGHLYARGWLEVADAPAVEAGVARWFEVAAALATRPGGVGALPPDGVEVTSIMLVHPRAEPAGGGRPPERGFLEMLAPRRLMAADVDPARLVVPAGFEETRWPGIARERGPAAPSRTPGARWHTLEDEASQRARAACGRAWLPDPSEGPSDVRGAPQ